MTTPVEQTRTVDDPAATCPDCGSAVTPDGEPVMCEIVICRGCDAELEVVGINPLALAVAPAVEEDWGE